MNPAPAHLEAKLRFGWDFTVGQIAAMIGGILVGFAWANWLSPIHGIGAAVTGVYVGGLPVVAGFVASQTEFDLWAVVRAALRWRPVEGSLGRASDIRGKMLLIFGLNDPHTPEEGRAVIKRGLEEAGVEFRWRLYDAEHAFGRDIGPRYDPEATDAAFAETVAMLKR